MGKRNKVRYQSKPVRRVAITLTGNIYLQYVDDEAMESPNKGDLMVYPYNDALHSVHMGRYETTGFAGYFKADVYDGYEWRLLLLNDFFAEHENYFSKSERPIDTYNLCLPMLKTLAGTEVVRTYREHYMPEEKNED